MINFPRRGALTLALLANCFLLPLLILAQEDVLIMDFRFDFFDMLEPQRDPSDEEFSALMCATQEFMSQTLQETTGNPTLTLETKDISYTRGTGPNGTEFHISFWGNLSTNEMGEIPKSGDVIDTFNDRNPYFNTSIYISQIVHPAVPLGGGNDYWRDVNRMEYNGTYGPRTTGPFEEPICAITEEPTFPPTNASEIMDDDMMNNDTSPTAAPRDTEVGTFAPGVPTPAPGPDFNNGTFAPGVPTPAPGPDFGGGGGVDPDATMLPDDGETPAPGQGPGPGEPGGPGGPPGFGGNTYAPGVIPPQFNNGTYAPESPASPAPGPDFDGGTYAPGLPTPIPFANGTFQPTPAPNGEPTAAPNFAGGTFAPGAPTPAPGPTFGGGTYSPGNGPPGFQNDTYAPGVVPPEFQNGTFGPAVATPAPGPDFAGGTHSPGAPTPIPFAGGTFLPTPAPADFEGGTYAPAVIPPEFFNGTFGPRATTPAPGPDFSNGTHMPGAPTPIPFANGTFQPTPLPVDGPTAAPNFAGGTYAPGAPTPAPGPTFSNGTYSPGNGPPGFQNSTYAPGVVPEEFNSGTFGPNATTPAPGPDFSNDTFAPGAPTPIPFAGGTFAPTPDVQPTPAPVQPPSGGTGPQTPGPTPAASAENTNDMVFFLLNYKFTDDTARRSLRRSLAITQEPTEEEMKSLICKTNLFFRDQIRNKTGDDSVQAEATNIDWAYDETLLEPLSLWFTANVTSDDYQTVVPLQTVFDSMEVTTEDILNYIEFYVWEAEPEAVWGEVAGANFTNEANQPVPVGRLESYTCPTTEMPSMAPSVSAAPTSSKAPSSSPTNSPAPTSSKAPSEMPSVSPAPTKRPTKAPSNNLPPSNDKPVEPQEPTISPMPTVSASPTNPPTVSAAPTITPVPTSIAESGGPVERQKITSKFLVSNIDGIAQPDQVNASGLAKSWPIFVREVVANITQDRNKRRLRAGGRRRLAVGLEPGSQSVDEIERVACPEGSHQDAACHNTTASYVLLLRGDEDPGEAEFEYGGETVASIDDGGYQGVYDRVEPEGPLIFGTIPEPKDDGGLPLWLLILIILLCLLCCLCLLLALFYMMQNKDEEDKALEPYDEEGFVYDFLIPPNEKPQTEVDDDATKGVDLDEEDGEGEDDEEFNDDEDEDKEEFEDDEEAAAVAAEEDEVDVEAEDSDEDKENEDEDDVDADERGVDIEEDEDAALDDVDDEQEAPDDEEGGEEQWDDEAATEDEGEQAAESGEEDWDEGEGEQAAESGEDEAWDEDGEGGEEGGENEEWDEEGEGGEEGEEAWDEEGEGGEAGGDEDWDDEK